MKLWKDEKRQAGESRDSLWDALGLSKAVFPCVISIVGSGGKTSLISRLAKEGKEHQLRVAVTTTTHIRKPPVYQEVFSRMEKGTVTIFGKETGEDKLSYPGDACYREVCSQADLILVEADGSRGLPVKYPGAHEPVVPENADIILCVSGMSGLGRPAKEVCHRWELALKASKDQGRMEHGSLITPKLLGGLLEEGYGRPLEKSCPHAVFYYCMNQADTREQYMAAAQILKGTGRRGIVLSLKPHRLALIYLASGFGLRYGSNKLLEDVGGRPLYRHGLEALCRAAGQLQEKTEIRPELFVVSQYEELLQAAETLGAVPVYNPNSREGITASIRCGIDAAGQAEGYLFAVADQPWLKAETVRRLAEEFYQSGQTIACLTDGIRRGNPVIFDLKYRGELRELSGDRGGSVILKQYPQEVLYVQAEEKELADIDVPIIGMS